MKTRLLFLSLSFFIASTTFSHAQVATRSNNILGSIKFSDKTINKKIYTNTVASISSYCYINDNTVALLDADEQKIVIYSLKNSSVVKTIYLPYSAIDFDYYSNKFYILYYDKVYVVNNNGIKESELNYKRPMGIPFALEKFKVINGRNILNISDGTTWEIASDGITMIDDFYWHYENGFKGRTEKVDLKSFELSVSSDYGSSFQNSININSLDLSDYLVTTRIISINNNQIALDIETSNDIDKPRRFLIITDLSGNFISKTEIPYVYETDIKSPFCKYKSSISYCLSTPDGLYFYEINSQKKQLNLPSDCPKISHFNNYLPKNEFDKTNYVSKINKVTSAGTNSVTRTQVYENAYKYKDLEWIATNANKLTSCTQITSGTYAKSPSWILFGNNVSVPYKWGGYTDWSEFANLAKEGKYTGNIFCTTQDANGNVTYTNGVCSNISNTGSSIIGVDCSGFVSRCWETGHFTTKSLPNISTSLGSADIGSNFSKLQVGDIINDYGSHVRLCLTNNPNGTATFMEASARDWKVSAYSYSSTQLAGYICYKYNNISDARLRLAQAITILPTTIVRGGSLTTTYKIGNYGTESWTGFVRLYIINSEGDETWIDQQGPLTLNANSISSTYSFSTNSVSSPAGATKLEVRVQNSSGGNYGRYYKVGAINPIKNPLEFTISGCTAPAQPGAISGNSTVCEGSNQTYSITAVSGATSYTWLIPNGWTYTENGTSVSCKIPTGSAGGTIKVAAVNSCGSSTQRALSVTTNALPTTTTINGGGTFCNSATLTASGGSGGTIYWQGTTSNGTSTATASSSQTVTTSGTYYFRSYNSCGWGTQGSASVTINSVPAATTVNGGGTFCNSATLTASGGSGGTIYWQGTTSNGTSTATASSSQTVTTSGTYYFRSYNSCGWGPQGSATVTINTTPLQPGSISGNSTVSTGNTYNYSISTVSGATSYTWKYNGVTQSGTSNIITLTPTVGGTLSVVANNNCGSSSQSTLIIVVANTLSVSSNTLSLNSTINSNGLITITSNTSWTASSNQTWLTVSPTSGSNNGNLTISAISANTSSTPRSATITVSGTGVTSQTITVTQQGTSLSLSLSGNSLSLNSTINSNGLITITSNTSWTASSNQTWLTVSPTSGSNNGNLTISAISANTSSTPRSATITVSGTGVTSQTITVTQQGTSLSLSLSGNSLSLNSTINSNGLITITSNTSWTASSNQTWLTVSPTSGSNNGNLTISAISANTSSTPRSATITVSGTGVTSQTITVTQQGTSLSLSLSGNSLSLNSTINSNGLITITSNTSWTASSNQTWLTVSPTSGSNNGNLTISAISANTSSTARSATVTVTGTGVTSQTITVTQQGTSLSLSLSGNSLSLNSTINSNGLITITSNTSWTASSNQTWLTVSPTSGSNNGNLTISAISANTATTARTATITVSGTGVASQFITVTQSGANQIDLTYGLVAYYPFNGNANDMSGNRNNGTDLVGGVNFVTGKYGQAAKFEGINNPGYIRVPNSTSLQFTNGASFVYWVRLDNASGMDGWGSSSANGNHCTFAKSHDRSGITNNMGYTSQGKLYSGLGSSDGGGIGSKVQGISGYTIGNWIQIAFSCSGISSTLYVNGVQDSTVNIPLNFSTSNTQDLYFGRYWDYWYPINGALDEFRIYNRPLSIIEIQQLYNNPTGIFDVSAQLSVLKLYPNPTQTFLRITSEQILKRIEVCDITGRVIDNLIVNTDSYSLNVSSLLKGVYLIKGFTDKGVKTNRLIKE